MAGNRNTVPIPEPSLRRLPAYCNFLRRIDAPEGAFISCSDIGREFNLDPTQVRKDLALTGIVGRPKVGYPIANLLQSLESFLGWNDAQDAFLVGVGSMGTALLGYKPFNEYGVNIVAAFDACPEKAGATIHDTPVFPMEKLSDLAQRLNVHLAILTVPVEAAQNVCDELVACGVRAIWNFAPTALSVPSGVIVQNENLFSSLAILSSKLAAALRQREEQN